MSLVANSRHRLQPQGAWSSENRPGPLMALVFGGTSDSWLIAWFLKIPCSGPKGGLGSWSPALAACAKRNVGSPQRWGTFLSQNLCGSRLLCNSSLQSSNYLDDMESPSSPQPPQQALGPLPQLRAFLTKVGECQALALLKKIFFCLENGFLVTGWERLQ